MRFAIVLVFLMPNLSFATDENLLDEYIQYGIELNRTKSESDKSLLTCVYETIFNNLDYQYKEYFRKVLTFKRNNPQLSIKQVEAETKALYDPSGEIDKSFRKKVELARPQYMKKCYNL
mgnify:CR=1 FL=1